MKIKNNEDYKKLKWYKKIYVRYIIYKISKDYRKNIKNIYRPYKYEIKNIEVNFTLKIYNKEFICQHQ